jgi:hypothetical protein
LPTTTARYVAAMATEEAIEAIIPNRMATPRITRP